MNEMRPYCDEYPIPPELEALRARVAVLEAALQGVMALEKAILGAVAYSDQNWNSPPDLDSVESALAAARAAMIGDE
jgi:hypothetical protein